MIYLASSVSARDCKKRFKGRAPYTLSYPFSMTYFFASCVTVSDRFSPASRACKRRKSRSTIAPICSTDRGVKVMISSRRFKNSGRKDFHSNGSVIISVRISSQMRRQTGKIPIK